MTAVAFKEPSVSSYPISNAARERIESARHHDVAFEMRRALTAGGFDHREAGIIVDVVLKHLHIHKAVLSDSLAADLHSRGFARAEAQEIAKAIAR